MNKKLLFVLITTLAMQFIIYGQTIRYVKPVASGSGNGSSWANASGDLQVMINVSVATDQVWVAAGTYKPARDVLGNPVPADDRNKTFVLKDGVTMYGGFIGTENLLSQRKPNINVCQISGDIGVTGINSDNSYTVIRNYGNPYIVGNSCVLDGFTIQDGKNELSNGGGGGMLLGGSSPTIRNCVFRNNAGVQGGAVYDDGSASPILINCVFIGNTATASGSAAFANGATLNMYNCTVAGNAGDYATIHLGDFSSLLMRNSIIWGNGDNVSFGYNFGVTINAQYNILQTFYAGTGNIVTDPLYMSAPIPGLGTSGDLHLQPASPAINAGNNGDVPIGVTTDLDGNARIQLSIVDRGAYESFCKAQGNPTVFGSNTWNVYAWNAGGFTSANGDAWNKFYSGYYTTNSLNFNTNNDWNLLTSPSAAANYQGCPVANDNHSWSAKRQGFPCGYYQLNIPFHDDEVQLLINGTNVFTHVGCCDGHTNVWTGWLGANDKIEFRVTEGNNGSQGLLDFVPITITCPGNIIKVTDPDKCSAVTTYNITPGNLPGITYQFTGVTTGNGTGTGSGSVFNQGITNVTIKLPNGCPDICTFTVTVNDNVKPVITSNGNKTVNNDKDVCGAAVTVSATATDNCSVGTPTGVRSDGLALTEVYPVGTTTITWNVTDANGIAALPVTQTVTVTDNQKPVITSNDNQTVNNDKDVCGAAVTVNATATDNCSVGTPTGVRSDGLALTAVYPVGTTTITWSVTDANGNAATPVIQTVTVTDNEKPIVTCAANQVFCSNFGGVNNYTIPTLSAKDNCGIQSITYAVSGATTRSGTDKNASGAFNTGISTVTWTVTDIHNNVSTCSFTVTINALPIASYTASPADAFCNKLSLEGASTLSGPFSYQWNNPSGTSAATTKVLQLGLTDLNGIYSLYTTDKNGCRSEFPATYTYNKENIISNYTIVGLKQVQLGRNNNVQTGSVGVTAIKGLSELRNGVSIASPGAFLKSPRITVSGIVNVPVRILSPASSLLPAMVYNTANTQGLPFYITRGTVNATINGNYSYVYILKGSNITLSGNAFGSITVQKGSSVTFSSDVVNIGSLIVGDSNDEGKVNINDNNGGNASGLVYSNIRFAGKTTVLVSNNVYFGNNTIVNADKKKVTFFVGHAPIDQNNNQQGNQEGDDATSFTVVGGDTKVTANVYVPNGKIQVKGTHAGETGWSDDGGNSNGNNDNKISPIAPVCYMTGLFIANTIESNSKGVIWNSYDCTESTTTTAITAASASTAQSVAAGTFEIETLTLKIAMSIYPNPSRGIFAIKLSNYKPSKATVFILSENGSIVEKRDVQLTTSVQTLNFDLTRLASQLYLVKVVNNDGVQTAKVAIQK